MTARASLERVSARTSDEMAGASLPVTSFAVQPGANPSGMPAHGVNPTVGDAVAIEGNALSRLALLRQELEIAKRYHVLGQRQTWPYVVLTIVGLPLWFSLLPLTILGIVPAGVAFLVSILLVPGIWIAGHEAMHSIIGLKGSRRRFWNELTGNLAMIPMLYPFSIARTTHLQHHRFCNDPLRDPDYQAGASTHWQAIVQFWLSRQPGPEAYVLRVKRILLEQGSAPDAQRALKATLLMHLAGHMFFIVMALAGHAIEVASIWWAPRWVAFYFIHVGLGWDPHHPHSRTGRYDNTRIFRSKLGRVMSMGIEGHLLHHLYPHIPMHLTKRALREMRPVLEPRGVDFTDI